MSTEFSSVGIKGLRATHFEQLQSYLELAEDSGIYYGNKAQFEKRHTEIKEWLDNITIMALDPDNIIPKR